MSRGTLFLAIFSGVQFVLLLQIYSNTDAVSKDLQSNRSAASIEPFPTSITRTADQAALSPRDDWLSENRLRQIIQEELRSHSGSREPNRPQQELQQPVSPAFDESAIARQRDIVSRQLDYYSSVGSISAAEMAQLHKSIAELDESGRREMLSRLNRALNTRALNADL